MHAVVVVAGGTVVHMGCGWSALAAAWFLGPADRGPLTSESSEPANVPFVVLGTTLLWFGWLGVG
jgi:Amt family ammonium transporter